MKNLPVVNLALLKPVVVYVCVASADAVIKISPTFSKLSNTFLRRMANLHDTAPQHVFISPSLANYILLPHMESGRGHTYDQWKDSCRLMMPRCDIGLVFDWQHVNESAGVADEVAFLTELGKPVYRLGDAG